MKIIKGNFGECRFIDCMDYLNGLPSLLDKSWDMCLTDPPYNLDFNGSSQKQKLQSTRIFYDDSMNSKDYYNWCWIWSSQILSKSKITIITPGYSNFKQWIIQYPDVGYGVWTNICAQGGCEIASFRKFEPFLFFNFKEIKQHNGLKFAWIDIPNFVDSKIYMQYKHPCPKNFKLWFRFIEELHPTSVLDPFLGSGTTAEVCEQLGIKWLGYEIMEEYVQDIEKRIKQGIRKYKPYKKSIQKKLY